MSQKEQKRLKDMRCPQRKERFQLTFVDYADKPDTLVIRSCPSGGVYDVRIKCPHCDYEEEL